MDEKRLAKLLRGRASIPDADEDHSADAEEIFVDDVMARLPASGCLSVDGSPALPAALLVLILPVAAMIGLAVALAHDHPHQHPTAPEAATPPSISAFGAPALLADR